MSSIEGLTTIYQNIGIILGISSAIAGSIFNFINQHFKHSKNVDKIEKITQYINEAHDFVTSHNDKFVGLVQAATDLSPELKQALEANGQDVNKLVADTEQGKAQLQKIRDEINTLVGLESQVSK